MAHMLRFQPLELTENDPKADCPSLSGMAAVQLKPHQLTLLHRCREFEQQQLRLTDASGNAVTFTTRLGIIGDKVGSGKSFVLLALLTRTLPDYTLVTSCHGRNMLTIEYPDRLRQVRTNLLVIPHNLINQWVAYVTRYSPATRYVVCNKQAALNMVATEQAFTQYDLVIVTGTFHNRLAYLVDSLNLRLNRVIYDEIDSLDVPTSMRIHAKFYWFVTASFANLLFPKSLCRYDAQTERYVYEAHGLRCTGYIKELFVDLHLALSTSAMKMLVVKNSDEYVDSSLQIPGIVYHNVRCRTPPVIGILHGLVDTTIISRLNAGDEEGAIALIDSSHRGTEDNIIATLMDKIGTQIQNLQLKREYTERFVFGSEEERREALQRVDAKLESLRRRVLSIQERVRESGTCSICYEPFSHKTIAQCCSNSFCFRCITTWLGRSDKCPMCKEALDTDKCYIVDGTSLEHQGSDAVAQPQPPSQSEASDGFSERFDKMQNLSLILQRLKQQRGRKILMYAGYDRTLSNVISVLDANDVRYEHLKGNSHRINCILRRFTDGNLDALLVNSNSYGSGLNLQNTTDIIMFHKFDSEMDKQVIGRAQRPGRTQPLNVWYLLHENEMR